MRRAEQLRTYTIIRGEQVPEHLVKDSRRIRGIFEQPSNLVRGTAGERSPEGVIELVTYRSFSDAPTVIDLSSYDPETRTVLVSQAAGVDPRENTACAPVLPYRAPVFQDYYGKTFVRIQHSTSARPERHWGRYKNVLVQKDVELPSGVKLGGVGKIGQMR